VAREETASLQAATKEADTSMHSRIIEGWFPNRPQF
jgi:hypothetical protein